MPFHRKRSRATSLRSRVSPDGTPENFRRHSINQGGNFTLDNVLFRDLQRLETGNSSERSTMNESLSRATEADELSYKQLLSQDTVDIEEVITRKVMRDSWTMANDFVSIIKGSDQIDEELEKFNNLYDIEDQRMTLFLRHTSLMLQKPLKLARFGLGMKLLLCLFFTYADMATDVIFIWKYSKQSDMSPFFWSISFLASNLFFQAFVELADSLSAGSSVATTSKNVVLALMGLCPARHSLNFFAGSSKGEREQYSPKQKLAITRVVELIFEALPEATYQFHHLLGNIQTIGTGMVEILSIVMSILACSFVVSDTSIGFERGLMDDQIRGHATDRVFGVLPDSVHGLVGFHFGHFLFQVGYMGTSIIMLTTATIVVDAPRTLLFATIDILSEVTALHMMLGRKYFVLEKPKKVQKLSLFRFLRPEILIMNFMPMLIFRNPFLLGGREFASWIGLRLFINSMGVLVILTQAEGVDDGGAVISYSVSAFVTALVCCLAGMILCFLFARPSHRHTLYSSTMSTKDYIGTYFIYDDVDLEYCFRNLDEARIHWLCFVHPHYHRTHYQKVLDWLLRLEADSSPLFALADGMLPIGAGTVAKKEYKTVFEDIKARFEFFGDAEASDKLNSHLSALLEDLEQKVAMETERQKASEEIKSKGLKDKIHSMKRKIAPFGDDECEDREG